MDIPRLTIPQKIVLCLGLLLVGIFTIIFKSLSFCIGSIIILSILVYITGLISNFVRRHSKVIAVVALIILVVIFIISLIMMQKKREGILMLVTVYREYHTEKAAAATMEYENLNNQIAVVKKEYDESKKEYDEAKKEFNDHSNMNTEYVVKTSRRYYDTQKKYENASWEYTKTVRAYNDAVEKYNEELRKSQLTEEEIMRNQERFIPVAKHIEAIKRIKTKDGRRLYMRDNTLSQYERGLLSDYFDFAVFE